MPLLRAAARLSRGPVPLVRWLAVATLLAPLAASVRADTPFPEAVIEFNNRGVEALLGRRWEEARAHLERAVALLPGDPVLEHNLAAACAYLGDRHRREGDDATAVELLNRAVDLHPGRVSYRLLRGLARFGVARDSERFFAREDFMAVLAVDPDQVTALNFAAMLAYQERRLEEAVRMWEHALRIHPGAASIPAWLERARRELDVERSYTELRGAHFLIRFGSGLPPELATRVLDACEQAYGELCPLLGHYPESVTVVTLYEPKEFRAATQLHPWVAGLSDGTIRLTVRSPLDADALRRSIYHEFTHHLIRGIAPHVPGWLHEGLAQRAEGRDPVAAATRLREERNLQSAELSIGILRQPDSRAVRRFYDLALVFTTYLHHSGGDAALLALLRGLAEGSSEHTLLKAQFGASRDELFARWLDTLRSG